MALPGMEAQCWPGAPAPEWPGAVSGKFTDKQHGRELCRRQIPALGKEGVPHGLARNGFAGYFGDASGLVPADGRRQLPAPGPSEVLAWRPSRRSVSEPGALHSEKPEGRRIVEEAPRQVFSMRERRHVRQVESKEEVTDRPVGPRTVYRDNGLRALDQPAREVDISGEMCRKVRPLDMGAQRNGIGCRSLGDKAYRHPEYEKGFHAAGNLIVGSSFTRGQFKKTEPRNSTSVHLVVDNDRKQMRSYEEKYREQQVREAQAEVEFLTRQWEAGTLKDCEEARYLEPDSEGEGDPA